MTRGAILKTAFSMLTEAEAEAVFESLRLHLKNCDQEDAQLLEELENSPEIDPNEILDDDQELPEETRQYLDWRMREFIENGGKPLPTRESLIRTLLSRLGQALTALGN